MRTIIDMYLKEYIKVDITKAKQAMNMDGGDSIYINWVRNSKQITITAGNLRGKDPNKSGKVGKVE